MLAHTVYIYALSSLLLRNLKTGPVSTLRIYQMFSVHTTPEEFENGGSTLKICQMFSVHTLMEELKNASQSVLVSVDL